MTTTKKGTNERLASIGRELRFVAEYPEFRNLTPYLIGAYATCRAEEIGADSINPEEAYEHFKECEWCQRHFKMLADPVRRALKNEEELEIT